MLVKFPCRVLSSTSTKIHYDATVWMLEKLCTESYDKLVRIAMILWDIWFFRNKRVWESEVVTPQFAADWSLKQLQDWKVAIAKSQSSQNTNHNGDQSKSTRWVAPECGKLKVNVNAAIVQGQSLFCGRYASSGS